MRWAAEEAAHGQLVVYEEGRGDNHPEADALVHVQLTCGLAEYGIDRLRRHWKAARFAPDLTEHR